MQYHLDKKNLMEMTSQVLCWCNQYVHFSECTYRANMQSHARTPAFICSYFLPCHVRGLTLSGAPDGTNHDTVAPCRPLSKGPCVSQKSHHVFHIGFKT